MVKGSWDFLVLILLLFCKFENISKSQREGETQICFLKSKALSQAVQLCKVLAKKAQTISGVGRHCQAKNDYKSRNQRAG